METENTQASAPEKKGLRATKVGVVTSNKMNKTIVVAVERRVPHPLYKRIVTRTKKFMAHDETNNCQIGDTVEIEETRPLSRHKRWRVKEVLRRAS
jgi:small subunit ribosomal protein S17